jgi:hypothetical protein
MRGPRSSAGSARAVTSRHVRPQEALAEATGEQLANAVDRWAETDEFWGQGDPTVLRPQLNELAEAARAALTEGLQPLLLGLCLASDLTA